MADWGVWGIMGGTLLGHQRRIDEGFFERFIKGQGIDIGPGQEPLTEDCAQWDIPQGDATLMEGVEDESFDWVYSSHCLEHLTEPRVALGNWWRILKLGGYLIVAVPDFTLYEHEIWPPIINTDHKTRWACEADDECLGLREELLRLPQGELIYCRLVDTGFDYSDMMKDQSGSAEV